MHKLANVKSIVKANNTNNITKDFSLQNLENVTLTEWTFEININIHQLSILVTFFMLEK